MEKVYYAVSAGAAGVVAFISARLGILLPILIILTVMMIVDYWSGMLASKVEAIDHPDNPEYGWNSKKGAKGITKKVGYVFIIAVAMVLDYIILKVAGQFDLQLNAKAFFGLVVAVWYILNELLSIIENVGRMGANIPTWLSKYIAVLKNKIDAKGGQEEDE